MSGLRFQTLHIATEPMRCISLAQDGTVSLHGMTLDEARAWIEAVDFDYPRDQARAWLAAYEAQQVRH